MTDLFSPLRLGAIELPNRIVMSSLTRNRAGEGPVDEDVDGPESEKQ